MLGSEKADTNLTLLLLFRNADASDPDRVPNKTLIQYKDALREAGSTRRVVKTGWTKTCLELLEKLTTEYNLYLNGLFRPFMDSCIRYLHFRVQDFPYPSFASSTFVHMF